MQADRGPTPWADMCICTTSDPLSCFATATRACVDACPVELIHQAA